VKQAALVWVGNYRRADAYDRTGKIDAMAPEEGRDNYSRACEAIAKGITYSKNMVMVTETFSQDEMEIAAKYARAAFVAWKGEEEATKREIGSASWMYNVRVMFG
jgi:hypothetical protein